MCFVGEGRGSSLRVGNFACSGKLFLLWYTVVLVGVGAKGARFTCGVEVQLSPSAARLSTGQVNRRFWRVAVEL